MSKPFSHYEEKLNMVLKLNKAVSGKSQSNQWDTKPFLDLPPIINAKSLFCKSNNSNFYNLNSKKESPSSNQSPKLKLQQSICSITFKNHQQKPERRIIFAGATNPRTTSKVVQIPKKFNSTFIGATNQEDIFITLQRKYQTIEYSAKDSFNGRFHKKVKSNKSKTTDFNKINISKEKCNALDIFRQSITERQRQDTKKNKTKDQSVIKVSKQKQSYQNNKQTLKESPKKIKGLNFNAKRSLELGPLRKQIYSPWVNDDHDNPDIMLH